MHALLVLPQHPAPAPASCLDLELPAELPSLHANAPVPKTLNLGVHQTGGSSDRVRASGLRNEKKISTSRHFSDVSADLNSDR